MDDLKRLLEASDRPRRLTSDEDARIRARLGLVDEPDMTDDAADDDLAVEDVGWADAAGLDIGVQRPSEQARRRMQRSWPLLAAAAALVLMIVLVGNRRGPSDEVVVVDEPAVEPTSSDQALVESTPTVDAAMQELAQSCERVLRPLTEDIAAWGGIDLWGATSIDTATPNLERSLAAALSEFGQLPATDRAIEIADQLRADLETASADEIPARVNPARVDAVESAARELAALLASVDAGAVCDLAAFDDALALGAR